LSVTDQSAKILVDDLIFTVDYFGPN
jgi:hypothetical protein